MSDTNDVVSINLEYICLRRGTSLEQGALRLLAF